MSKKHATNWTLQGEAIEDDGMLFQASESEEWISGPTILGQHKHKTASRVRRAFRKESGFDDIEINATYISGSSKNKFDLVLVTSKNQEHVTIRPLSSSSSILANKLEKIDTGMFLLSYKKYDGTESLMTL